MLTLQTISDRVLSYLEVPDGGDSTHIAAMIEHTFAYAKRVYTGKKRLNGDDLFTHVLKCLEYLLEIQPDIRTIQLCLLHDVLSYGGVQLTELQGEFGEELADLLAKYEELKKIRVKQDTAEEVDHLRQMLLVLADDVRVILVKLVTKIHGLETIQVLSKKRQHMYAKEALEVFAPIASRLGVYVLKVKLEDEAYRILRPHQYARVRAEVIALQEEFPHIIEESMEKIATLMELHDIHGMLKGRVKSIYSIARKLKQKGGIHVGELHDVFAVRALVGSKEDCYRLFGLIHGNFPPVTGRIKDYIANPKANNYQSLHTTVTNIYEDRPLRSVELQIRTYEMNEIAEYGIAAHSMYKEKGASRISNTEAWQEKLAYLNKLYSEEGGFDTATETSIGDAVEKVFVFTPRGDIKMLKRGATALDFAYAIHTEVGHTCIGVRVNGRVAPLDTVLMTGDSVEVVTRKGQEPTASSLLYVKTSSARSKIRTFLYAKQKDVFVEKGRKLLTRALAEDSLPLLDAKNTLIDPYISWIDQEPGLETRLHVLERLGKGAMGVRHVLRRVFPDHYTQRTKKLLDTAKANGKLMVDGEKDIPYELAGCCFRDGVIDTLADLDLVGYITREHKVRVHKRTCNRIQTGNPKRFVSITA